MAEQGNTPGGRRGYAGTWPPRSAAPVGGFCTVDAPKFVAAAAADPKLTAELFSIEEGVDALYRDCRPEVIEIVDRIQGVVVSGSVSARFSPGDACRAPACDGPNAAGLSVPEPPIPGDCQRREQQQGNNFFRV
jgi:hypothetical protein